MAHSDFVFIAMVGNKPKGRDGWMTDLKAVLLHSASKILYLHETNVPRCSMRQISDEEARRLLTGSQYEHVQRLRQPMPEGV